MAETSACALCGREFEQRGRPTRAFCRICMARADKMVGRARTVKCGECGKPFSARTSKARYCSDPCRSEGQRRYYREYMRRYMEDPGKRALNAARARAYSAARRARAREERESRGQGQGRRRQAARAAGRPQRAAPPRTGACALCGRAFEQYGHTVHSYCRRCTAKADREIAREKRAECRECGKRFSVPGRTARYCSDACRAAGQARGKRKGRRRRMADPENRAMAGAYTRAWVAAKRKKK